ncbi:uncharacterized protein BHQ10_009191 [Talaromyces amestolkiae]|uniref:Uncharacterized protein n=1 Tax=Talaromyces amestolkiae TaxID=1196081 RepID=A0A364LBM6_TALAM|nr:uncharacterized protein BHQ10_009191 [Talaromyces amestolkiae]RAO73179.1 hypothetical protein BHQ10_009191 [Talaromyces amestolkiae]
MEPNSKSVIDCTTYQLLQQSVDHKPQNLYAGPGDQFKDAGVATEFRNFERKDLIPRSPIKVAVVYPTTKVQKTVPLQKAIESYREQHLRKQKDAIDIKKFYVQVKDTGVGEQPLHPNGLVGALNRIYYIQDVLLKNRTLEQVDFDLPVVQNFDRIIIPSLESDIFFENEVGYDKPNLIFYECFTRELVAGMGTGPGIQKDIFQLSQELGRVLFNNDQAVTYGKTLQALFPERNINHADWHGVVYHPQPSGKQGDRAYFIEELCEAMGKHLNIFFDKVFSPYKKTM